MSGFKHNINLFSAMDVRAEKQGGLTKSGVLSIVLIALSIVLVGGIFSYYYYQNYLLNLQVLSVQNNLNDETLNTQANEVDVLTGEYGTVAAYENSVSSLAATFDSQSTFTSELMSALIKALPADVSVVSFTLQNGALTLSLTAPAREEAAQCALALENTQRFVTVHYQGYTYIEEANLYSFTINGALKGGLAE